MKFIDNSFPNWLPNACFCAAGLCSLRPRSAQMSLLGCRPSCSSPVCNQSRQQIARSKSPVQNWSQLKTDLSETCSCSNFARLSWKCFVWKMSRRRTHGIVAVAPCDKKHRKAKLQTCASWWRTPSIRRCSFLRFSSCARTSHPPWSFECSKKSDQGICSKVNYPFQAHSLLMEETPFHSTRSASRK